METIVALFTALGNLGPLIIASPFLIIIALTFIAVWLFRKIFRVWKPMLESNRWFKTLLPIGVLLLATMLGLVVSLIPAFALTWYFGLIYGILGGGALLIGYGFARNWIREREKEILTKFTKALNKNVDEDNKED